MRLIRCHKNLSSMQWANTKRQRNFWSGFDFSTAIWKVKLEVWLIYQNDPVPLPVLIKEGSSRHSSFLLLSTLSHGTSPISALPIALCRWSPATSPKVRWSPYAVQSETEFETSCWYPTPMKLVLSPPVIKTLPTTDRFKYLGSMLLANNELRYEIVLCISRTLMKLRCTTRIIYGRHVNKRLQSKVRVTLPRRSLWFWVLAEYIDNELRLHVMVMIVMITFEMRVLTTDMGLHTRYKNSKRGYMVRVNENLLAKIGLNIKVGENNCVQRTFYVGKTGKSWEKLEILLNFKQSPPETTQHNATVSGGNVETVVGRKVRIGWVICLWETRFH